jgi:hypothetical protein
MSRRLLLCLMARAAGALLPGPPHLLAQMASPHPQPQVQPKSGVPVAKFVDFAGVAGLNAPITIGGLHESAISSKLPVAGSLSLITTTMAGSISFW